MLDTSPYPTVVDRPAVAPVSHRAWSVVKSRVQNISWEESTEAKRRHAMQLWLSIVQIDPRSTTVGDMLLKDITALKTDQQLKRTLNDIFASKATSTMIKRAQHLARFLVWTKLKRIEPFPIKEPVIYEFLYEARLKSATFPASFREALNFAAGTIGLIGAAGAAASPRIIGFAHRSMVTKSPSKQACPLKLSHLATLEKVLNQSEDALDSVFSGHCLLCVNLRARWSDAQFISSFEEDEGEGLEGFIQANTLHTKTSTTAKKRTTFLPMSGIRHFISDDDWFKRYIEARSKVGLAPPDGKFPLLPVVQSNGTFGKVPLSAGAASSWLRNILQSYGGHKDVAAVSSHSCKTTLLSWAAKAGIDKSSRATLGYHVEGAGSMLHYSRDEQAGPLRKLELVLRMVRAGDFHPDRTRSGYYLPKLNIEQPEAQSIMQPTPKIRPRPDLPADARREPSDSESSTSSSNSDTSSSSGKESDLEALAYHSNSTYKKTGAIQQGTEVWLHTRWKTIHVSHFQSLGKLACGKPITVMYKNINPDVRFPYHRCVSCFGREDTSD
jgi:hypothetical protein